MPRRKTAVVSKLPLFLVTPVVSRAVIDYGEEIDWIDVRRGQSHFYAVRIRTRPVKRELQSQRAREMAIMRRKKA